MGNNDLTNSENILVKVDHNNLIYVDPNSVLVDGEVQPRGIKQENLVMYVNLEADLIPRTTLISSDNKNTLTSIAKGTLNFLKNGDGRDYDTSWTDAFSEVSKKDISVNLGKFSNFQNINLPLGDAYQNDKSAQTFGIDSISIQIKGANFIPQVNISFIDVRGKTLFESPENSPYNAFFHIPWPIFYLTVKGFYGKAIRYRLHLVKFNSKFNDTTGNFEINTSFVGSTYAFLSDIPLKAVMNCPYMYLTEVEKEGKFNTSLGVYEKKVSKSSRGYKILTSVFNELKQKKLIGQDVPVKTLREIGVIAKSLDKLLEKEIFDQVVEPKVFAGIKEFSEVINNFETSVNDWSKRNLSPAFLTIDNIDYFDQIDKNKTNTDKILGPTVQGTLEQIIELYRKKITESNIFNKGLKNNTNGKFVGTINVTNIKGIKDYYGVKDNQYRVAINKLFEDIFEIKKQFNEQKKKLEEDVEKKMNEVIKKDKIGLGFSPTVRNLFGIILANAEVYVRLMREVHFNSFNVGEERKKYVGNLSNESKGSTIYPWPEIKKNTASNKQKVVAYPGEEDLQKTLKSYDKRLWPEVGFVEEFIGVTTNLYDPLAENEGGVNNVNYVFESNSEENRTKDISSLGYVAATNPYINKTMSSFLYEIWERSYYFTLFDSFDKETIKELSDLEFDNIKQSTLDDLDIVGLLKNSIKTTDDLKTFLRATSQFDRYPFYQDQLATVDYIKSSIETPYTIEQLSANNNRIDNDPSFPKLNNYLLNYTPEPYRKNIYPYNSNLYLSYLNETSFADDNFKFNGTLKINTRDTFISSPLDTSKWVKSGFETNLFSNKLKVGQTTTHILNTPYFHNQLYSEFFKSAPYGKYVGSAYLLLNSLPFLDLEDINKFGFSPFPISSLFREVGSTHYLPYHLILKWGSIYHRYKNYIQNGTDILSGCLTGVTTLNLNGSEFFNDQQTGATFTNFTVTANTNSGVSSFNVTYSGSTFDIGIHPYYDAIFHQIVNDYNFYVIESGDTSYSSNNTAGAFVERVREQPNKSRYWTGFVNNSRFDNNDLRYTLLPSDGASQYINKKENVPVLSTLPTLIGTSSNPFTTEFESYFRIVWEDDYINNSFTGKTFNSSSEYPRTYVSGSTDDNKYSLGTNYRKVIDLIGTFSPTILDSFEQLFLEFASENLNEEIPLKRFSDVKHDNFQKLLKEIVTVKKETSDSTDVDTLISQIKTKQKTKLLDLTTDMLANNNVLKITLANPKEIDSHVFHGFSKVDNVNTFSYDTYNNTQLTVANQNLIKLYIGEDIDSYYQNFFIINDVELNEDNIKQFRPLILIYAGYVKNGGINTKTAFQDYVKQNVFVGGSNPHFIRQGLFLQLLISNFTKLQANPDTGRNIVKGYNNRDLKIELYNFFKSFNDKWVAGNSLGQRLLMEEFMFLDKANQDIGDVAYLNLDRFISLLDSKNDKINLYTALSVLIQGTGFDMRVLPSYVNFYGTSPTSNNNKITPSKNLAANLFGTFLEVDYQESSPKVVIQYIGPTSKHPDMSESKKYGFNDDSFDIGNVNQNPLIITAPDVFNKDDFAKSNKVVAFEVSFGDQNQGIFKGVSLDQASIKNTSESFVVMENLARSESGSGTYNVDIGLFEIYRQASYSCEVTCMGDVMIQPTMFFYLKNIPMFKGSYWITEVSHDIRNNNITTRFKGSRIPTASLPDPKDSFMSSYKPLFDKINAKAIALIKNVDKKTSTTENVSTPKGNYATDPGGLLPGEELIKDAGVTEFGVPFNGFNDELYIQKVKYENDEWLRARVVRMGSTIYQINDATNMSLVDSAPLPWSEIKDKSNSLYFYSCKFSKKNASTSKITSGKTTFYNPKKQITFHDIPFEVSGSVGSRTVKGQINVGPNVTGYGLGMSQKLMDELKLVEGDVVYFKIK